MDEEESVAVEEDTSLVGHDQRVCLLPIERIRPSFPSVTERYFDARFFLADPANPAGDHCVLFHSNRICIVTLAPSHPILAHKKHITAVNYKVKRLKNRVSGKFKKGGQKLLSDSVLCTLQCDDESNYTVYACIKAILVELNEKIAQEPCLVSKEPWSDGFVAILLPGMRAAKSVKDSLLSHEAYQAALEQRIQSKMAS